MLFACSFSCFIPYSVAAAASFVLNLIDFFGPYEFGCLLSGCILNMSKEMSAICDDLHREIRQELKDFRDSFERELRKELREIKSSMPFTNQAYEELKGQVSVVLNENKDLKT